MKNLLLIIWTLSFIGLKAQKEPEHSDDFLTFIHAEKNIKALHESKLLFDESDFQFPPDSLKHSQIDALYQTAICYWINASSSECDSLHEQTKHSTLIWSKENFKKVISNQNSEVNYYMLSEPLNFKNLTIIKFKRHDKHGFSSGIEIYERTKRSWKLKQTLNPMAN